MIYKILYDFERNIISNINIHLVINNIHVLKTEILIELLCLTIIDDLEDIIISELLLRNYI